MGDDTLNYLRDHLLHSLRGMADPLERAKVTQRLIEELPADLSKVRFDAMKQLSSSMTHVEIGDALDITRARVSQILKAGPPPERALLAPDSDGPMAVAVVEKRDENGRATTSVTTQTAVGKLREFASTMDVIIEDAEVVPPPGIIDLNRNNLAVLIGPRISSLIAQIVASDPAIQWRRDTGGHWYLVDSKTGREFHSDFDHRFSLGQDAGQCIAQIGRIRRPDGQGSFLYLGGAHAPGTAGAVDVFVREYSAIWEQAKRSLWSAIVITRATEKGVPISAELATPIYIHGKR